MVILIYCLMLSAAAAIPAIQIIPISSSIPSPLVNAPTPPTLFANPTVAIANGWPPTPYWFLVVPGLTGEILEYSDVKVVAWEDRVLDDLAEIELKIYSDGGYGDPFPPQTITCGVVTATFSHPNSSYPVPPLEPFNRQMARFWIHKLRTLTLDYGPKAISSADILIANLAAIRFSLVIARSRRSETSKRNLQSYASASAVPYTNAITNIENAWPLVPFRSEVTGHPPISLTIFEYGHSIQIIRKAVVLDALAIMEERIRTGGRASQSFTPQTVTIGLITASFDPPNPPAMRRFTRIQAASMIRHVRELTNTFGPKEIVTAQIRFDEALRAMFSFKVSFEAQDGTTKRSLPSNVSTATPQTNTTTLAPNDWPPVPFHVGIEGPLSMTFMDYDDTTIANRPQVLTNILEIIGIVKRSGFDPLDPAHTQEFSAGDVVVSFVRTGVVSPHKCTRRQAGEVMGLVYGLSAVYRPKRIRWAYIMIEGIAVMGFRLEVNDGTSGTKAS